MLLPCVRNVKKKLQVNLIGDDSKFAFELSNLFAINIKKEICYVLESFLYFQENLKKKKILKWYV